MNKMMIDLSVVQQTLDALSCCYAYSESAIKKRTDAITSLTEAIETGQQAQQEPVAIIGSGFQLLWARHDWSKDLKVGDKLYAFPQLVTWQKPLFKDLMDKHPNLSSQITNELNEPTKKTKPYTG